MTPEQSPPPPPSDGREPRGFGGEQGWPRWTVWVLLAVFVGALFIVPAMTAVNPSQQVSYGTFLSDLEAGKISEAQYNNRNGNVTGKYQDGNAFSTTGPVPPPDADAETMQQNGVTFVTPEESIWQTLIIYMLPLVLVIGFFLWMQRRASSQMGGIMSVGRSKAKLYTTERPDTTFVDVAGYDGVKQEITEIVDFLKHSERFSEIGARIPKGVLLVGPPGTGKTLIARAVAGEAGVPFLSVTGSDFMEMFVGVGASRVRDLFQTARKMGKAIIFIDEIDSIGRKRGAGLGGGHDEREQTLNQMLAEMDGFEVSAGIVMMAATNRPDILDPALLRRDGSTARWWSRCPSSRTGRDPRRARQGQAHEPRRRPGRGRPRHAGDERRRPGQPGERGGAVRRARG
ncbi:MAG: ATP-dependent metallopeptidase FtsH/Yme1/Tma family protein [Acidimicrobiales bacterium]